MSEQPETEQEQEQTEQTCTDIVIWCHPKNVRNLVQAFQTHIDHAGFPAFVLWSGLSGGRHMGVVVIEWEGAVSASFLHDLRRDFEIVDFVVYDWERAYEERENPVREAEDQSPLNQLQTIIDCLQIRLDIITNLQYVPYRQEVNAVLQMCERVKTCIPSLEQLPKSSDFNARMKVQNLADQLTPLEKNAVLLRQVLLKNSLSLDELLPDILHRQLIVKQTGQTFLRFLTEAQKALVEMDER